MSGEIRRLEFVVTVADHERWSQQHLDEAERDTDSASYADWVDRQLRAKMLEAGQKFVDDNPDLFLVELM